MKHLISDTNLTARPFVPDNGTDGHCLSSEV